MKWIFPLLEQCSQRVRGWGPRDLLCLAVHGTCKQPRIVLWEWRDASSPLSFPLLVFLVGLFIGITSRHIPEKPSLHIIPQSDTVRADSVILSFNKFLSQPRSQPNAPGLLTPRQGWRQGMRVQVHHLVCCSSSKVKIGRHLRLQGQGACEDDIDEGLSLAEATEKTNTQSVWAWSTQIGKQAG